MRLAPLPTALLLGALVGLGWPLGELWLDCRVPTSEGCVWGKSLLPVSLTIGAGVGAVLAMIAFHILRGRRRRDSSGGNSP